MKSSRFNLIEKLKKKRKIKEERIVFVLVVRFHFFHFFIWRRKRLDVSFASCREYDDRNRDIWWDLWAWFRSLCDTSRKRRPWDAMRPLVMSPRLLIDFRRELASDLGLYSSHTSYFSFTLLKCLYLKNKRNFYYSIKLKFDKHSLLINKLI